MPHVSTNTNLSLVLSHSSVETMCKHGRRLQPLVNPAIYSAMLNLMCSAMARTSPVTTCHVLVHTNLIFFLPPSSTPVSTCQSGGVSLVGHLFTVSVMDNVVLY